MNLQDMVDKLRNHYDPENDLAIFSWCDAKLLDLIEKLLQKINKLEGRIEELEQAK